jgi:hypothetical protein
LKNDAQTNNTVLSRVLKVGNDRIVDANLESSNNQMNVQIGSSGMNGVAAQSSVNVRKRESMSSRLEVLVVDDSAMNRKMMVRYVYIYLDI